MCEQNQRYEDQTHPSARYMLNSLWPSIFEMDRLLDSIGVPATEESREILASYGPDVGEHLDLLITNEIAGQLWNEWNRNQRERLNDGNFLITFRTMLAEGVRMGFSTNRFRGMSRSLPNPTDEGENWAAAFEGVVAGRDKCRISLSFAKDIHHAFVESNTGDSENSWNDTLSMMKDGLFYELGIILPTITVGPDETLNDNELRIEWNDVSLPPYKGLAADRVLVNDTVDRLTLLNIEGEPAINPANGSECSVIDASFTEMCERAGLTTWNNMGYVILILSSVLRRAAGSFVNRYLVWYLLDSLDQAFPELVDQARGRIDIDVLIRTLRGLLDEEISIRDLSGLLEAMLATQAKVHVDESKYIVFAHNAFPGALAGSREASRVTVDDYVNNVRVSFMRYISHKYARGQNTLVVYLVDPMIEERLGDPTPLQPEMREELLKIVRIEVGSLPPTAQNPVILTTSPCRLRLRNELRHEFPRLAILAYQELSPDMNIQPIARISPESTEWNKDSNK